MANRYSSRSKRPNRKPSPFRTNDLTPEAAQQVESFVDVLAGLLTDPAPASGAAGALSDPLEKEPLPSQRLRADSSRRLKADAGAKGASVASVPPSEKAMAEPSIKPAPAREEAAAAPEPTRLNPETPSRTFRPFEPAQVLPVEPEQMADNEESGDRPIATLPLEATALDSDSIEPVTVTLNADPALQAAPAPFSPQAASSALVLSSTPVTSAPQAASDANVQATSAGEELNQLRTLLVSMESRFYDPDKLVKLLLPGVAEAIRERLKARQSVIANVLRSEMATPLQEQIAVERDAIIDALYPVIGSTVAEYFTETLRTINSRVADTAADRETGSAAGFTPAEEKETAGDATAAVRALFLIHRSTGLALAKVFSSRDMTASVETQTEMLTSVRSFADATLAQAAPSKATNTGKHRRGQILLEVADTCYLAAIVTGDPTVSFLRQMRQVLNAIAADHREVISTFEGNVDAVPEDISQSLKRLLNAYTSTRKRRRPIQLAGTGLLLLGAVAASIWGLQTFRIRRAAAFSDEVQRTAALLNQASGIAITAETVDKQVIVEGEVLQFNDVQEIVQSFEQITDVEAVIDRIEAKPSTIPIRVYFYTGSTIISPRDIAGKISDVGALLDENPEYSLRVLGYQNPTAETETPDLGLQRALGVADVLADQGIARERLDARGSTGVPPGVNVEFQPWLSQAVLFEIERPQQGE